MEDSNCMIPKPPLFEIRFVDSQEQESSQNNNNPTMDNNDEQSVVVTNVIVPDSMTQSLQLTEDENYEQHQGTVLYMTLRITFRGALCICIFFYKRIHVSILDDPIIVTPDSPVQLSGAKK